MSCCHQIAGTAGCYLFVSVNDFLSCSATKADLNVGFDLFLREMDLVLRDAGSVTHGATSGKDSYFVEIFVGRGQEANESVSGFVIGNFFEFINLLRQALPADSHLHSIKSILEIALVSLFSLILNSIQHSNIDQILKISSTEPNTQLGNTFRVTQFCIDFNFLLVII